MSSKRYFIVALFADCYLSNPYNSTSYVITSDPNEALQSLSIDEAKERLNAASKVFPGAKPVVCALINSSRVVSL